MIWQERIENILSREEKEEDLENKVDHQIDGLKSGLKRGEHPRDETGEVLSEEEKLERELLDL
ncbi:MAG: hypothetical protein BRC26_03975, partial [Nanohaloarchaea archaeon QH_8_44_6]